MQTRRGIPSFLYSLCTPDQLCQLVQSVRCVWNVVYIAVLFLLPILHFLFVIVSYLILQLVQYMSVFTKIVCYGIAKAYILFQFQEISRKRVDSVVCIRTAVYCICYVYSAYCCFSGMLVGLTYYVCVHPCLMSSCNVHCSQFRVHCYFTLFPVHVPQVRAM